MEANPKLPVALNGRRKAVNAAGLPALTAPYQLAEAAQGSAILLPKWRAALAQVKTGVANARILCIGDSITFGYGSAATNLKPLAWPTALAQAFNNAGLNAHSNSIACNGNGATAGGTITNAANDARVTLGSGWSAQTSWIGVGGASYGCTSSTSNFSFTPTEPVDTFIITYGGWGSGGTFSYNVNGGSNSTQSTTSVNAGTVTITAPLGINTVNLNYSSGELVLITGIEAYDSSKTWVSVINAGWYGSNSWDWTQNTGTWSPINQGISTYAPALTIIALGINDIDTGTISPNNIANGVTQANLQLLINAAKVSGDVVLQTTIPANPAYPMPVSMQQGLYQTLINLAAKNNIAIVDTYGRFQSYAISNGNGLMYDNFHPGPLGYSDIASAHFNLIGTPFIPSAIARSYIPQSTFNLIG